MRITIYGAGYVGLVTSVCFAQLGHHVCCVDVDLSKIETLNAGHAPIFEAGLEALLQENLQAQRLFFTSDIATAAQFSEIQMIAVGTPAHSDGSADLQYVDAVATQIGMHMSSYRCVVNKSTVPVGTSERVRKIIADALRERQKTLSFDVVSNPEFLREGQAIEDCLSPDRIVIGSGSEKAIALMQQLYKPIRDKNFPLLIMDPASAELTKYAANAFLATKVSFINEISQIAEKTGADIREIKKGIGLDDRIGEKFLDAGCGFGGSCFPKDVSALKIMSEQAGYTPHILNAVLKTNAQQQELLFHKVSQYFQHNLKNKIIALWGLAFKPNTDDVRSATSRVLMELFWKSGATVRVYDPLAMNNIAALYPDHAQLILCDSALQAAKDANAVVIVTEWPEFRRIDFSQLKLSSAVVFDGRNVLNKQQLQSHGIEYFGIGC
ncbi:MAG: UDP-glucose 6-dehydrogenase [Gammaproteobacteria bacterium RIFCSPLOWO2_02_FULL_42_14]|nr:MAG: UDP-glucose 6-dehydrogenase [Gammaproteobacteria bacterium RIFCSPHIGHO2_02_FULL_42_43]OGT28444.1 MAG: UDP-glucose 6-dehydrogenase [Gammaproteobacteria bacterium RIFCSPHIGHO2_01_FULL_42_8]OGT51484.1 MAG: UDP-glucose 6-dehydrogenase [Gammaproteobacteria bacterium RIFCSPHIGHO2_12_FULL_41_25]OGT62185.1 MAG: UDP-glucose 6-dehydrogenase [Gammaproteobacteria bacterium RIFCSPLOWO2_02_FULL_42_14]OGT85858.1 MAG: UDP-glucose 6-dehydrogenase [Gammaproteobacteria bacterium RIFCSPLOWO2_12_FULL_42_18]